MGHNHHHHHNTKDSKNILIAFILNFSFSLIEFVGGYLTNSVAIYSDAIHDLGDSMALLFAYFAEKFGTKKADENYNFGYRRFSVLGAFINGVILLSGGSYVIFEACTRLMSPQPVKAQGMLWLAVLGIAVNAFAAFKLSKNQGLNAKMVMYHLLEDLLGWCAVLVVSIILLFKPWYILDSILSIGISLFILRGVFINLKKIGRIFLHRFPENLNLDELKQEILVYEQIESIQSLKAFGLDDEHFYLSLKLKLASDTCEEQFKEIKSELREKFAQYNITESTIESS